MLYHKLDVKKTFLNNYVADAKNMLTLGSHQIIVQTIVIVKNLRKKVTNRVSKRPVAIPLKRSMKNIG